MRKRRRTKHLELSLHSLDPCNQEQKLWLVRALGCAPPLSSPGSCAAAGACVPLVSVRAPGPRHEEPIDVGDISIRCRRARQTGLFRADKPALSASSQRVSESTLSAS